MISYKLLNWITETNTPSSTHQWAGLTCWQSDDKGPGAAAQSTIGLHRKDLSDIYRDWMCSLLSTPSVMVALLLAISQRESQMGFNEPKALYNGGLMVIGSHLCCWGWPRPGKDCWHITAAKPYKRLVSRKWQKTDTTRTSLDKWLTVEESIKINITANPDFRLTLTSKYSTWL